LTLLHVATKACRIAPEYKLARWLAPYLLAHRAASGGQIAGVVFHRIVQQRGAGDVGVADDVMADDSQRDVQQVIVMPTST
jgi:hypothetical protein